jgi:hypothetical protein
LKKSGPFVHIAKLNHCQSIKGSNVVNYFIRMNEYAYCSCPDPASSAPMFKSRSILNTWHCLHIWKICLFLPPFCKTFGRYVCHSCPDPASSRLMFKSRSILCKLEGCYGSSIQESFFLLLRKTNCVCSGSEKNQVGRVSFGVQTLSRISSYDDLRQKGKNCQ